MTDTAASGEDYDYKDDSAEGRWGVTPPVRTPQQNADTVREALERLYRLEERPGLIPTEPVVALVALDALQAKAETAEFWEATANEMAEVAIPALVKRYRQQFWKMKERAEAAEARLAENERVTEMRRVEGERILKERNAMEARLAETQDALRHYAEEGNDSHDTGCLRHPMHWPDENDGKPGYERTVGGPDAECTCRYAVARVALAALRVQAEAGAAGRMDLISRAATAQAERDAAEEKNKKLSALIVEQERQYGAERDAAVRAAEQGQAPLAHLILDATTIRQAHKIARAALTGEGTT